MNIVMTITVKGVPDKHALFVKGLIRDYAKSLEQQVANDGVEATEAKPAVKAKAAAKAKPKKKEKANGGK